MAATCCVALKFLLFYFVSLSIKRPSFTNAASCCYSYHGEKVEDPENTYITASLWEFHKNLFVFVRKPKYVLQILLLLAGDIETCPGPRARCCKCNKCFRRNIDHVICIGCDGKFHKICLNVVLTNNTCDICLPSQATENIMNSIDNSAELRNLTGKTWTFNITSKRFIWES